MISYIIPTRNRKLVLEETLHALDALGPHAAEVIVVDNASDEAVVPVSMEKSGMALTVVHLPTNIGAAARNVGARRARGDWLVMLDDDSQPQNVDFAPHLGSMGSDVVAVMADIFLPDGRREQGGLPEVFIGCGVAIRRESFLRAGGYDASFGYYAEEYDLAAAMLRHGGRICFDPRFKVLHRKVATARGKSVIMERLVRNNGWVIQRYAPEACRRAQLGRCVRRYRAIANCESALGGYSRGLMELRRTLWLQERRPMESHLWDRFTGLTSARLALAGAFDEAPFRVAALVGRGKNDWAIEIALAELGCRVVAPGTCEDVRVVGTLSPGPMLDMLESRASGVRLLPSSTLGVYAVSDWAR